MAPKFRSAVTHALRWTAAKRLFVVASIALAVLGQPLLASAAADAEKPLAPKPQETGRLIHVPLPITGDVDLQVKSAVQRALSDMKGAARPILIFEIAPPRNQQFGQGNDFGRAWALANYISGPDLSGVRTIAFVPHTIKGHAMLVVMACQEIVMAPDAQIGDAGVDEPAEQPIGPALRNNYHEIADRKKSVPAAIALKMLDRQLELLKVETDVSREFVLRGDLDDLRKKRNIQSDEVLVPAGELAHFSGRQARELGLATLLAADHAALAKELSLPAGALEEDPSLGGEWHSLKVVLRGVVTPALTSRLERMIQDHLNDSGVNFICLAIDSPGGSLEDSINLANYLASLDPNRHRTVAYIEEEARGDAAVIAAACDQIVMHPRAVLGGSGAQAFSNQAAQVAQAPLREIARSRGRSWSLSAALIDPNLKVYRCKHNETGATEYFSQEELDSREDANAWTRGEEVTQPNGPLRLTGREAEKLGLARHVVQNYDEFRQRYNLKDDLALVEPGWAHFLIDALAAPGVAWVLLFIGFAALYAELQAPGVGVGAFISGVCFLLFFWSRQLDGTAGWLEVLLFLAGVGCILLEIFVVPGATIFGLGGGLLVLASLILASQTFILPHNDYQLGKLRDSLLGLLATGVAMVVAVMVMRRYLPRTPLFSHMMLEPPSDEELERLDQREALVDFHHLLGHEGLAMTALAPSGKARFGGELVDVMADGELIDRGARVTVVEVRGNRVLVRSAGESLDHPV